jgi:hypothetical protein
MKRLFLFLLVGVVFIQPVDAQEEDLSESKETSSEKIERNYQNIVQGGLSFGSFSYGYIGSRTGLTVPLSVAYEKYFADFISIGGFFGYAGYRYKDINDRKYGWSFINFGPRASFHYIHFLNEALDQNIDTEKFDFYLSAMIIFEIRTFSSEDPFYDNYYDNDFGINLAPVAGFRYRFTDNLSVYFEGGRSTFGYGTLGVSFFF